MTLYSPPIADITRGPHPIEGLAVVVPLVVACHVVQDEEASPLGQVCAATAGQPS